MWSLDAGFKDIVKSVWSKHVNDTLMFQLVTKLKNLKKPLKELNRNRFSDIEKSVGVAKAILEDLQIQMHREPTDFHILAAESEASETYKHLCKDFFRTGKLLKQVNTTTLTLIPKVTNPVSVIEFRPIACCNTVYKAIAKVIFSRLNKICQLLSVKIKREQMLQAFKFPQKLIELVMSCVTSPIYSLAVNGSNFGFFPGKRGLRQGYPLSSLLFTLCMEYLSWILGVISYQEGFRFHPLCRHTRLNHHLLFAYGLLMFCKGTKTSIMWILRSLSTFFNASSLTMNKDKTEIYLNGVPSNVIDNILQVLGFHQSRLPFKYLGVPISAKKLTKTEGMKLNDKIVARIKGLGNRHLSAWRLILVQSVLTSLHAYWAKNFFPT
ncbi:uncharacterized protein LOC141614321 [Silene latifolia]|uniref:uncharacterized protein LOC141614321 n=1 Tax=Silene latifolia TaxID=37657 RepID=UPI003D77DA35